MQSIFEPKNELPFDADAFEGMQKVARDLLRDAEAGPFTQAIVLLSAQGEKYGVLIPNALSEEKTEERALMERVKSRNDTEIRRVLCQWQDGGIDLPSADFRRMLCALNVQNTELGIFVMTGQGVSVIPLNVTLNRK